MEAKGFEPLSYEAVNRFLHAYPDFKHRTDIKPGQLSALPESWLRHHFVCFYTPIETHNKEKDLRNVRPDPTLEPMD